MLVIQREEPWRHWIMRGVMGDSMLARCLAAVPPATHPSWVRYDNDDERRKWACNDLDALGQMWRLLFARLHSPTFVADLERVTGVEDLRPDPELWGAGLHVTFPGGHLSPHVDSAISPRTGLERRVNLVLYLNDHWLPAHGGGTTLSDWDGRGAVVYPEPDTALVWCCGDDTIHGADATHPTAPPRVTAAAYYWTVPRPGATRRRALFLPRRS